MLSVRGLHLARCVHRVRVGRRRKEADMRTAKEDFMLDRFAFASRMIKQWIREFGVVRAEETVCFGLALEAYTEETAAALRTAFGR